MIKQALISVSDKSGILDFTKFLIDSNISILSTGGTARFLKDNGIAVTEVADYTGVAEMLDGRVKTLHPKIHGGLLAKRDISDHMETLKALEISTIDYLIVNLYPFRKTIDQEDCTLEMAIENIDIGGPAMVRAGAKNYRDVTVVVDPSDYEIIKEELKTHHSTQLNTRFKLASKAFVHTARYDSDIANYLNNLSNHVGEPHGRQLYPTLLHMAFEKLQELRYGENPHQSAAFYRDLSMPAGGLAHYQQLQGKPLSYNNLADANAAWDCIKSFTADENTVKPVCVIVKHANPCGVAQNDSILGAYQNALTTDAASAFGGIIAFNCPIDKETANALIKKYVEVILAPDVSEEAAKIFSSKPDLRVIRVPPELKRKSQQDINNIQRGELDIKRMGTGMLLQTPDTTILQEYNLRVVTREQPTAAQLASCLFAWKVVKHVKSNAIVFCKDTKTLGIGAGQMSRVDAARIAVRKAIECDKTSLASSVVASDAFFPFRDGLDVIAEAGAKCIIQPGGSKRDDEVIAAANEHNIVMIFTGIRHFRH